MRPIFKKGDRYDSSNYSLSNLSVFSKILEKLIYNRLTHFINEHNILTDAQHGFRDNKSNFYCKHSGIHGQTAIHFRFIFLTSLNHMM